MRIADSSIARNYTNTINRNKVMLNKKSENAMTWRNFNTVAEDHLSAVRALNVRRSLARLDGYVDNTKTLQSKYNMAYDMLSDISTRIVDMMGTVTQAADDAHDFTEYEALAKELGALRDAILQNANSQLAGKYIFGGTNLTSLPLDYNPDTGVLKYNGIDIRDITAGDKYTTDETYLDIGMGMEVDANGNVNPNTAFSNSLRIIDYLGYGDDNLILLIDEIIAGCNAGDVTGDMLTSLKSAQTNLLVGLTALDGNAQYLSFTLGRLESEEYNLIERQDAIESMDPEEAIYEMKLQEYVYNACLQIGARLLQPSLFNYL